MTNLEDLLNKQQSYNGRTFTVKDLLVETIDAFSFYFNISKEEIIKLLEITDYE